MSETSRKQDGRRPSQGQSHTCTSLRHLLLLSYMSLSGPSLGWCLPLGWCLHPFPGVGPSLALEPVLRTQSHMYQCYFLGHHCPAAYGKVRSHQQKHHEMMTLSNDPWGLTSRAFLLQASLQDSLSKYSLSPRCSGYSHGVLLCVWGAADKHIMPGLL